MLPTAMILADRLTSDHVLSARPDAPTVPEDPPRHRAVPVRTTTAAVLRRLADRVEPGHAACAIPC